MGGGFCNKKVEEFNAHMRGNVWKYAEDIRWWLVTMNIVPGIPAWSWCSHTSMLFFFTLFIV